MNWKKFSLANNLGGWLVFVISALVYLLTIEPTASLWDCAEFIACDYRLEVGHPPGAPFYMLVYNAISHLAPDISQVALYANATSALLSALTILLMYWTITHILRRLIVPSFRRPSDALVPGAGQERISTAQGIIILGAALVGSLVYTFTDTFWFSAVEAEVYAFSSFCTALVVWLMFQWDERSDSPEADRWLVLIAYMMGLSIGVHLLNLLCLPAMALIYYYRKAETPTLVGAGKAILVSFVLIIVMMYGVVQGVPKMAGHFDLFFVNTLGLSFNSGLYTYLALVFAVLAWSVYESHQAYRLGHQVGTRLKVAVAMSIILMGIPFFGDGLGVGVVLSLALAVGLYIYGSRLSTRLVHVMQVSLLAIAVGFSSYGVILVRAIADTPMNENAPDNAFSLRSYLAREQYGSTPLVYGPSFTSEPMRDSSGRLVTSESKELMGKAPKANPTDPDRYTALQTIPEVEYRDADKMLFPRMHSRKHAAGYNGWIGRAPEDKRPPTFGDNIRYFFVYQVNYMYWRYFLWNFVGRQNDVAGQGELTKGNAITGFSWIDELIEGPQDSLPASLRDNKGRNVYYALPLLLGLLGIVYQGTRETKSTETGKRGKGAGASTPVGAQSFWIVFFLFFMTGLAILLYLNQKPSEPRERDYAYAGSFYAYAIWIGIGVVGVWRLLVRTRLSERVAAILAVGLCLIVPIQMASQNWDDHDRSGRTIARDIGYNYLESVEPNAILFCFGDNDTFPLWYMQDVEGVRTDVRTVNLSYLAGDWYVDQMHRKTYEGEPIPKKHLGPEFYKYHEVLYVNTQGQPMTLDKALSSLPPQAGQSEAILPTAQMSLPIDRERVEMMLRGDTSLQGRVLDEMPIILGQRAIDRGTAVALDMIAANEWKRPIYWTSTAPRDIFANLREHNLQTGLAFQLLPVDLKAKTSDLEGDTTTLRSAHSGVRLEMMYDNVMNKFRWGGADNARVYFDEQARNMMHGMRGTVFAPLAHALVEAGDLERAQAVLRRCLEVIRPEVVPYYHYYTLRFVDALYRAEMTKEADTIAYDIASEALSYLDWMMQMDEDQLRRVVLDGSLNDHFELAMIAYSLASRSGSKALDPLASRLSAYDRLIGESASSGSSAR